MINALLQAAMNIVNDKLILGNNPRNSQAKMSMNVVTTAVLAVLLMHNANAQYNYPPQDLSTSNILPGSLPIKFFVMNCFPANNLAAFVNFETDRVNRLRYGELSIMIAALRPNSDFVIQFREALTDGK